MEINSLQGWICGSHQPPYKLLSARLYLMHFLSLAFEVEGGKWANVFVLASTPRNSWIQCEETGLSISLSFHGDESGVNVE